MLTQLGEWETSPCQSFSKTGLSKAEILRFFDFPNGCSRHLLFLKSPNFLANGVQRIKTHEHVKFWQNRSIGCKYINIFQFLKMASDILDFWGGEILLAIVVERAQSISMPNFVIIAQSVAKILRFFNCSRWRPPPSWIFEIVNFYLLTVSAGPRRITVANFVKISRSVAEILHLFEISRWPTPPSWIFEIAKFYWLLRGDASACQILSKSVNRLRRY